jgi:hypothetical protein
MRITLVIIFLCFNFVSAQENTSYTLEKNDAVFIITSNGSIFDQARNELVNELRDEFSVSISEINETATIEEIARLFNANGIPKAVVLIGNNAIRMYLKYSTQYKENTATIQVVTILALDVQRAVSGITNVNAISYETPMVTALVNFRRVLDKPIYKVGVVYRKAYREFVEKQARFCRKENIEIKGQEIGDDAGKYQTEITEALKTLLKKDPVDALWIVNDNILLKPELLGSVWLPALKKNKAPLIVGVEALVNPKLNFGTFAVIPDPVALGEQAAEIIFDLKFDNWSHSGIMIHPAISTYSVLNVKKATEFTDLEKLKTFEVSKVLN